MNRRCQFLDDLPQYNYNEGIQVAGSHTGLETNTKKLGSTLMNAMLKEVYQFCNPKAQVNWSGQAHQQVIK